VVIPHVGHLISVPTPSTGNSNRCEQWSQVHVKYFGSSLILADLSNQGEAFGIRLDCETLHDRPKKQYRQQG
jgi:hypothetical protein